MTASCLGRVRVVAPVMTVFFCFLLVAVLVPGRQEAQQSSVGAWDRKGFTADQGKMSLEDRALMQEIRQAIHHERNLSYNRRNIRILTHGGKVILQGPVESDQEKGHLEMMAGSAAGPENVTNQLEVTATSNTTEAAHASY